VPRLVLRRADGWWDVVPVSTAIRAPRVLLWLMVKTSEQRRTAMWFLGVDWGERHHDLCLLDQDGRVLAARRIAPGAGGAWRHRCREVKRDGTAELVGCSGQAAAAGGTAQPARSAACLDRA